MRIGMWSGPRNLSTACMYAFGSRPDFSVWDEPFYAAYLNATGIDHPMRQDVLASDETNAQIVASQIVNETGNLFLKLMSFHMLPGFPMRWAEECVHIHLIRHPARVVASYQAKREQPTLTDIGFEQQAEMYERFPGPVIESFDIRQDPKRALGRLCAEIGLTFDPAMLGWSAGPKPFDGVWAPHWYDAVHHSTGFAGPEGPLPDLDGDAAALSDAALPFYQALAEKKLTI